MAKVTAISSLGWAHYTLYEALPRMAAMGFKRIEIASFYSYCFHFNFGNPTPKELRKMLNEYRLTPVCFNYCGNMYDAWRPEEGARYLRDMTRKIEQVAEVGIPLMSMQGFGVRNTRKDIPRQLSNAARVFDRVAKIGARHSVRMLLEVPHLYHIHSDMEKALRLFELMDSPNVGALVDPTHWGAIGYDIDEFLARLGDRLWHVHLRDAKGTKGAPDAWNLEMTPGRGAVDFQKFGAAFDKVGYRGDVSLEFEYRDVGFDAISKEFQTGMQHLRRTGWSLPAGVSVGRKPGRPAD